jgi:uncharacterized protein (TIGR03083 family)
MTIDRVESPQLAAATRAAQDIQAAAALSARLPDGTLARPSILPEWSVGDVLRHMAGGAYFLTGCLQAYTNREPTQAPEDCELSVLLTRSAQALVDAAEHVGDVDPDAVAAIYGREAGMPMSMLADILDFEFATHLADVSWSLGTKTPLGGEAVDSVLRLFGEHLHRIGSAGAAPNQPTSFTLESTDGEFEVSVSFDDGRWTRQGRRGRIHVAGPSHALAMLILGRIDALDPWLTLTGEPPTALEFNRYFPGPA